MVHEDGDSVDHFQYLHDLCVVWASEIQAECAVAGDRGELGDCVRGVLFPGAGESDWQQSGVHRGAAEDHAGGDHAAGFLRVFGSLSEGAAEVELYGWIWAGCGGRILRLLCEVGAKRMSGTAG